MDYLTSRAISGSKLVDINHETEIKRSELVVSSEDTSNSIQKHRQKVLPTARLCQIELRLEPILALKVV